MVLNIKGPSIFKGSRQIELGLSKSSRRVDEKIRKFFITPDSCGISDNAAFGIASSSLHRVIVMVNATQSTVHFSFSIPSDYELGTKIIYRTFWVHDAGSPGNLRLTLTTQIGGEGETVDVRGSAFAAEVFATLGNDLVNVWKYIPATKNYKIQDVVGNTIVRTNHASDTIENNVEILGFLIEYQAKL